MKCNAAIPFDGMARSRGRTSAPKPPVAYGKWLAEQREKLGLDRRQLAERAKIDYNTVLRVEIGDPLRSVKGANAIREALLKEGLDIPQVPIGDENWHPPTGVPGLPQLDPADETVRRNLVRFREAVDLDQFAAAFAARISYEELRSYELGQTIPTTPVLKRIADAYGCTAGAFLDATADLPAFDPARRVAFHFGGPGTKYLTDVEREALTKIASSVSERERLERQKLTPKSKKPK